MVNINKDYVNQSLINQIAGLSMQIAERDALITEQQIELEDFRKQHLPPTDGVTTSTD